MAASILAALLVFCFAGVAITLPPRAGSLVSLRSWGDARSLTASFSPHLGDLVLSNRTTRISFRSDNKRAEFNGVGVWLTRAPIVRGDDLLLSPVDLEKVLSPLWSPPRARNERKVRTIAIGAGHGGKDPGKQVEGKREKDYTLKLAQEVGSRLRAAGFEIVMVRNRDVFVDLLDRASLAKRARADLYLSLHFNGVSGPGAGSANGVEVYCLTPAGISSTNDPDGTGMPTMPGNRFDAENVLLAWHVQRALVAQTLLDDRGVKRARFLELTQMAMPAVLVEAGFMSHPKDSQLIFDWKERHRVAEAITDGVLAYRKVVERPGR